MKPALLALLIGAALTTHGAPLLAQDWPPDECPLTPGPLQNGDFSLKDIPLYNEAFTIDDVCFWNTNDGPLGGTVNRNARLIAVDQENNDRAALLYHAVHLAPPQWRDPSYLLQHLQTPLAVTNYDLSLRVRADIAGGGIGLLIGLTSQPLSTGAPLTSIFGNPFHNTDPTQLLPLFDQVIYLSDNNDLPSTWTNLSISFPILNSDSQFLYIFPIKYGVFNQINYKIINAIYVDDVSLTPHKAPLDNLCGLIPTALAPQPLLISEGDNIAEEVPPWGGPIPLEGISDNPMLDTDPWTQGAYLHRVDDGSFQLISLDGQSWTPEEILSMFALLNMEIDQIYTFSGGHSWVDYHCTPCLLQADFNGDNTVNATDALIFNSDFGCIGECAADANGDGLVSVLDLLILNQELGRQCPQVSLQPAPPTQASAQKPPARPAPSRSK